MSKGARTKIVNDVLQWLGTVSLITMYMLMALYPQLYPYNILAGLIGGLFYFTWSWRVDNTAQLIVNIASITMCMFGLYKAWG